VFITISGVTSTKLWKGFQYPLGKSWRVVKKIRG
jgi:hypothetical protein